MTLQKVSISDGLSAALIGELLVLPGAKGTTDNVVKGKGYIDNIDGLDPVAAQIPTANNTTTDGVATQDPRVGERNIVLTLGFSPNWAIGENYKKLRQVWYRLLPPGKSVILTFWDDIDPPVQIKAVVETHTNKAFGVETDTQISLLCPLPAFVEMQKTLLLLKSNVAQRHNYKGSAPTGFLTKVVVSQYTNQIYLGVSNQTGIIVSAPFNIGDTLYISTIPKNRYIRKVAKNGTTTNMLDSKTQGSLDLQLSVENPNIRVSVRSEADTTGKASYIGVSYNQKHVAI